MIRTISFDAGGVLVNPNWERVAATLRRHGVAVDAATLERAEPAARRGFDRPSTIAATDDAQRGWLYFNNVLEGAGIPLSNRTDAALHELRVYHTQSNLWESVTPDAVGTLTALRTRGLTLIVVSNANGRLHALFDRLDLSPFFEVVVDSCVEGIEKPDPRLFRRAMARAGAQPATTLHVGDLYNVDVTGARAAGMQPVLLDVADLYPSADCTRIRSLQELIAIAAAS